MDLMDIIYDFDWEEDDVCTIHRGPIGCNHVEHECWCYPLELTVHHLTAYTYDELYDLIESFLRTH